MDVTSLEQVYNSCIYKYNDLFGSCITYNTIHAINPTDFYRMGEKYVPSEIILKEIGANFRVARLARGLSQQQLADVVGCERYVISRIERGVGDASLSTVAGMILALEISPNKIFPHDPSFLTGR